MNFQHKQLAEKNWVKLSFCQQMANVGSEVERAIKWTAKDNLNCSRLSFERALELLGLTIDGAKKSRLKELTRLREVLIDYFVYENIYRSSAKKWHNYFYGFNYAARL